MKSKCGTYDFVRQSAGTYYSIELNLYALLCARNSWILQFSPLSDLVFVGSSFEFTSRAVHGFKSLTEIMEFDVFAHITRVKLSTTSCFQSVSVNKFKRTELELDVLQSRLLKEIARESDKISRKWEKLCPESSSRKLFDSSEYW